MSRLCAAIYDPFMRASERACLGVWRSELLSNAEGRVLEIGAGTGRNLEHYPEGLERLVVSEPDPHMRRRLEQESARLGRSVEVATASADALPFADASFDTVVSTLVLCSVPDPNASLAEVRRVLAPGGRFVFLEHVAADDRPERLRWQERLDPLWRRIAGGCRLTRRTHELIESTGFEMEWVRRESVRKALPIVRASVRGLARR